jgi:hypothetical protein
MAVRSRNTWQKLATGLLPALVLAAACGCTLHRNLLFRYHLEVDCDDVCDDEVPGSADDHCRCGKCSKLGRAAREPHGGPTPAQLGHARFHPLPSKPVFPEPDGSDMADMGPPAPQSYLRQHEPLRQPGRIIAEPSLPAPDLQGPQPAPRTIPDSGWDVAE